MSKKSPSSVVFRQSRSGALLLGLLIVVLFTGSYWLRVCLASAMSEQGGGVDELREQAALDIPVPQRIVALAPSTVEVLYALGLGDRVVGVSRYCTYPEEALEKPMIAGFMDVDYETMVSLKPDCVVMVDSQISLEDKMHQLGVDTLRVEHTSVNGIIESFHTIGQACGKAEQAELRVEAMRGHLERTRKRVSGLRKPRVLVCIERDPDSPRPDRVIIAGSGGFHRELIEIAGGVNAYQGGIAYPVLSREKLLHLNPDVIIDLVRDETMERHQESDLLKQWAAFGELRAVMDRRVVIISGNQHLIPGPRFLETLDEMVEAIHP